MNELIIGIGGLILAVLTYFAGVIRTERRLKDEDKEKRKKQVIDQYLALRRTNTTGGFDGLIKAGVATLYSDEEIREVCTYIEKHGEKHPLGSNRSQFDNVDLKRMFDHIIEAKINIHQTPVEQIISAIKA